MRMLYFLVVFLFGLCFSSSLENNGTFGGTINGEGLIKLGRKLHKPMMTLIGMAIRNIRVNQAPCAEWTPWTSCDATRRGYFGTQTRNRSCSVSGDSDNVTESNEHETKLCEGVDEINDKHIEEDTEFCPDSYNITTNGFCLKLNKTAASNNDAVKQCQLEGGYLAHVDSQQKLDDVMSIIDGYSEYISIDGRRKETSSPWVYKYGSQRAFLNWESGHPDNYYSNFNCLFMWKTPGQINNPCASEAPAFLCEILKD